MEDSILGLDAASVLGEKANHGKQDIRILDNKIILVSKEALFELIKTGWFWESEPSEERIEKIVNEIEQGRRIEIGPRNTRYCRPCDKAKIILGLEMAMNGKWTYREKYDFTTPSHLKKCFDAFVENVDFDEGKAELLMKIILCGHIGDVRDLTEKGVIEVERERAEQVKEKERQTIKDKNTEPKKSSSSGLLNYFRKKIKSLKYSLKNEWEPKYIGGRLIVSQHGNKYKVVAFSTTDSESITVWDKSEAVVKSASWEGSTIVLNCGFGIIHLWGPNNNDY